MVKFGIVAASAQSNLDRVIQSKTLIVCTTGDYKPYTWLRPEGGYEGIDICLTQSLAKSLEAEVKWVPTTWKNLTNDFIAKQWSDSRERLCYKRSRQTAIKVRPRVGHDTIYMTGSGE